MRTIIIDEKMANAAALYKEPLEGFTPNDIRQWLIEHNSDDDLATAYALVANQAGWLMHDIGDPDNSEEEDKKIRQRFDEWWALDDEILQIIIDKIKEYNVRNISAIYFMFLDGKMSLQFFADQPMSAEIPEGLYEKISVDFEQKIGKAGNDSFVIDL